MSLTNPNKVVTEERLSEFYGEILPYLGGMPELLGNKISRGDLYSTTEKIIGQWTDGKPLYQRTITGTTPATSSETDISTGITGASNTRIVDGYVETAYEYAIPVNTYISSSAYLFARPKTNGTTITFDSTFTSRPFTITLQYTKTADSAQAIGVDTDYSTTEKIVGTWIDGKPLYQKVIEFTTAATANEKKEVNTGISNGSMGFLVGGYIIPTSANRFAPMCYAMMSNGSLNATYWTIEPDVSKINFFSSAVSRPAVVILQYTKN